jgi:hypothetical protein
MIGMSVAQYYGIETIQRHPGYSGIFDRRITGSGVEKYAFSISFDKEAESPFRQKTLTGNIIAQGCDTYLRTSHPDFQL